MPLSEVTCTIMLAEANSTMCGPCNSLESRLWNDDWSSSILIDFDWAFHVRGNALMEKLFVV